MKSRRKTDMRKNKNGPTVVFKDGTGSTVYLKHINVDGCLAVGIGVLPGGAVFKTSREQAEDMLTSSRYRPATRNEIVEHLESNLDDPKKGLTDASKKKELDGVPADPADYFEKPDQKKGVQIIPGLGRPITTKAKAKPRGVN